MASGEKVVLVTGASRGLGRAIALEFAAVGYRVAITARDAEALASVAEEARSRGGAEMLVLPADLSVASEPSRVVDEAARRLRRLDVLVNNAGNTKCGDFLELSDADHFSGFELKYHGTVRACRAALPLLPRDGAIINIAGIGAHTPDAEFTVGGPVNSAIINFSKALADRCRTSGPRVNVVCPGFILTERHKQRVEKRAKQAGLSVEEAAEDLRREAGVRRFGEPQDIARMVAFLASDAASYVHGAVMTVDGGATRGI